MQRRLIDARLAERAAETYITNRGFEILGRNVRLGALEIDLVARKGSLAIMVEVRTRGAGSFQGALESVSPKKRATLLRAADRLWREQLSKLPAIERFRLDVAAVALDPPPPSVEYIEGAFTA